MQTVISQLQVSGQFLLDCTGPFLPLAVLVGLFLALFLRREGAAGLRWLVCPAALLFAVLMVPGVSQTILTVSKSMWRGSRFVWLLFAELIAAYGITLLLRGQDRRRKAVLLAAVLALVLLPRGTVYSEELYTGTSNPYKVPDVVVEACDIIADNGGGHDTEKKVLMPAELSAWARQYDASVLLPASWFISGNYLGAQQPEELAVVSALRQQPVDLAQLLPAAQAWGAQFLIVPQGVWQNADLPVTLGYTELARLSNATGGGEYVIYQCPPAPADT